MRNHTRSAGRGRGFGVYVKALQPAAPLSPPASWRGGTDILWALRKQDPIIFMPELAVQRLYVVTVIQADVLFDGCYVHGTGC